MEKKKELNNDELEMVTGGESVPETRALFPFLNKVGSGSAPTYVPPVLESEKEENK